MNFACSGIAPKGKVEDWLNLVAKEADPAKKQRVENGMKMLYEDDVLRDALRRTWNHYSFNHA